MYYKLLGLNREPFSTSPDPDFFYYSQGHRAALKRLEIQIRLRRGMSLVCGDVGTGKTTLSRILMQQFSQEKEVLFFMILDPGFETQQQFLSHLVRLFSLKADLTSFSSCRHAIEGFLFSRGVRQNRTIVLLIDEAQKIKDENLEFLRTLLNFETNDYKLLQLVVFSQLELLPRIFSVSNLADRIASRYVLNTLDANETQEMIMFRLKRAGYQLERELFSKEAVYLIQDHTEGYPRKIALLCHELLENAVMKEKFYIEADDVKDVLAGIRIPVIQGAAV